ncbi:hypothetical protein SADUNF_Sadunf17G0084200 [Salix dunnii]|uniref:Uncharacterized protein n=1 Tax=Salix dunnii TaxID=1413687 RepID=A0A835J641_9ROSI|nr:hypothetical protein SADUNF_Sadunf17G0084200 [Salix dunnii]
MVGTVNGSSWELQRAMVELCVVAGGTNKQVNLNCDHYCHGEEKESLVVLGGVASLPPLMTVMVSEREGEEG